MLFENILPIVLVSLFGLGSAVPILDERSATWDNRTISCSAADFGGCCTWDSTINYYSQDCYNATLVEANEPNTGGWMPGGTENLWGCSTLLSGNAAADALLPRVPGCCQLQYRFNMTTLKEDAIYYCAGTNVGPV